jgi:hypothetical protein
MKTLNLLLLVCYAWLTFSCENNNPPSPYVYDSEPKYTRGIQTFHGSYYKKYNYPSNVISLSLYTDSIRFDDNGSLTGVGQYLFLEDIFVQPTDSCLQEGIYVVSNSAESFTVLPGKLDTVGDQIFPIGSRISYYEKDPSKSLGKFITSGTFTVSHEISNQDTIYSIAFNLFTSDKLPLKGTFKAPLVTINDTISTLRIRNLTHVKTNKIAFK